MKSLISKYKSIIGPKLVALVAQEGLSALQREAVYDCIHLGRTIVVTNATLPA